MLAVAPFVGLLILVGLALFMQRKASLIDSSASTSLIKQSLKGLQPVALPFAALICLVCLCAAQLISVSFFELLLISFGICGIGIAQLKLPNFLTQLINAPYASSIRSNKNVIFIRCTCIRILLIASIVGCCFLTLETPYRTEPMEIFEPYLYIQTTMIALAVLTAYFVGQQRGVGPRICVWIFACIGLAQYFVWQFKGTTILPTDLFALGTAAAVAGDYTYVFNTSALIGIVWALIGNLLCTALAEVRRTLLHASERPTVSKFPRAVHILAHTSCALLCFISLFLLCSIPNYTAMTGEGINYFYPIWTYQHYGSMLSFVMGVQDLSLTEPANYSSSAAQTLLTSYAETYDKTHGSNTSRQAAVEQFAGEAPSIVVVMDESFADLSIYEGMHAGYEGPHYFKTELAPSSVASGSLSVSVLGGGTCNTEFEFLTGISMAYLGAGKYPYAIYDLSETNALPKQLSSMGYETTAIHPNLASNWKRDDIYEQIGFDTFYSIESFSDAPTLHNGVTNRATYDKVIEVLNSSETPQFIFDVTMQGHSNYDVGNIPDNLKLNYEPEGISDTDSIDQLNEYLSCVQASDEDLQYLVEELSKLDKPVVLVYFGDHQPKLSATYNDLWFSDESDELHAQRTHQSIYAIWTNYTLPGQTGSSPTGSENNAFSSANYPISPNYLAAYMLESIGAPLSDYQKAQLVMKETIPAINAFGIMDSNGNWHSLDTTETSLATTFQDLSWLTWLEFTSKVA